MLRSIELKKLEQQSDIKDTGKNAYQSYKKLVSKDEDTVEELRNNISKKYDLTKGDLGVSALLEDIATGSLSAQIATIKFYIDKIDELNEQYNTAINNSDVNLANIIKEDIDSYLSYIDDYKLDINKDLQDL